MTDIAASTQPSAAGSASTQPAAAGGWIETSTGVAFDVLTFTPADIRLDDIAHALSMICRYGGHSSRHYSVAEHSVYVAHLAAERGASPAVQLGALLHDAGEAYTGDLPRPLKQFCPRLVCIEKDIQRAVFAKFGAEDSDLIGECDKVALASEATALLGCVNNWLAGWPAPVAWLTETIRKSGHAPGAMRDYFLRTFGVIHAGLKPVEGR